jgi:hypothetical protein
LFERVSSPPPFVFHHPAGSQDQRELLDDAAVDRILLHGEADIRHPKLPGVRQRRIFRDEIGARRKDWLALRRNGVRTVPRHHAGLAVAIRGAAVLDRHALDAARQVDRP